MRRGRGNPEKRFKELASNYTGAVFQLDDGRFAVRGELIHTLRYLDNPEGTVIIDPELIALAFSEENNGKA